MLDWPDILIFQSEQAQSNFEWLSVLFGALVGGAISFATTYYFHREERKRIKAEIEDSEVRNLFALYLSTSSVLSDIAAIERAYSDFLPPNQRPDDPATYMLPLLGPIKTTVDFSPTHLSYVRGSEAEHLVDKLSNLANLRNLAISLLDHYNRRKTAFSEEAAQYSTIGDDNEMAIELDKRKHQRLILEQRELNKRAAAILDLLEEYRDFSNDVISHFNRFTAAHSNKSVNGFQIVMRDTSG